MFNWHDLIKFHKSSRSRNDAFAHVIDKSIYIGSLLGPIMTIPQLKNIWIDHNAAGVSPITWTTYGLVAVLWLTYGLIHKLKPIIVMNSLWIVIDILVVVGTLIYG